MKITKSQLKQIIQEELSRVLLEDENSFEEVGLEIPNIVNKWSAINMKEFLDEKWESWSGTGSWSAADEGKTANISEWISLLTDNLEDYIGLLKKENKFNFMGTASGTDMSEIRQGIAAWVQSRGTK